MLLNVRYIPYLTQNLTPTIHNMNINYTTYHCKTYTVYQSLKLTYKEVCKYLVDNIKLTRY